MTTLHLTLKMTTAQVVETSVTNNSLSKGYPHPEDHDKPIINILRYAEQHYIRVVLTGTSILLFCVDSFTKE